MGRIWEKYGNIVGNFESRSLWECSTTPQNIILDHVKIALPGGPVLGTFGNMMGQFLGIWYVVGRWYVHPIIIPLSAMLHSLVANSFAAGIFHSQYVTVSGRAWGHVGNQRIYLMNLMWMIDGGFILIIKWEWWEYLLWGGCLWELFFAGNFNSLECKTSPPFWRGVSKEKNPRGTAICMLDPLYIQKQSRPPSFFWRKGWPTQNADCN